MKKYLILLAIAVVSATAVVSGAPLPLSDQIDFNAEWEIVVESLNDPMKRITFRNSYNTSKPVKRGNTLRYENVGGMDIDLTIMYAASKDVKGGLEISSVITNNEDGWLVLSMEGPTINGVKASHEDAFMMPMGTGFRLPVKSIMKAPEKGKHAPAPWFWLKTEKKYMNRRPYPSMECSMQWAVIQGKEGGYYFASHDDTFSFKYMRALYDPATGDASVTYRNQFTCFPGQTVKVPSTTICRYDGDWYAGADIYREWFLKHMKVLDRPEWAKNNSGWLLAILKQQNDEVIVSYDEIGTVLADAAEARGIDVIGLFGRGIGGHDRFYPDYSPDPKLGGKEALKRGIAAAQAKGKRIILYTNGQLLDMNETPQFWPDTGKVLTIRQQNGTLRTDTFHKYYDAPARHFGLVCHSCQTWRDIMLRMAKEANELGADGILYDQLAVVPPMYCYSPDHGHPVPTVVYANDRADNMKFVQEEMAKINPEFIVMTEGLVDMELNTIGMFHAFCHGAIIPEDVNVFKQRCNDTGTMQYYTEMFSYTFPENVTTFRLGNPANSRYTLHYNLAFHFRNEMELRYAADRRYVEKGIVPVPDDYKNVIYKPNLNIINQAGAPDEAVKYYKQALDFQKKHADLMVNGRYLAGKGIEVEASSRYVITTAWKTWSEEKLGVLVWNLSDEPVTYKVTYPGYTVKGVEAPDVEGLKPGDTLAPQSIHLVLFEK